MNNTKIKKTQVAFCGLVFVFFIATLFSSCKIGINPEDKTVTFSPSGITAGKDFITEKNTVKITEEGIYTIGGTSDDAQIIVDAGESSVVELVLANASLSKSSDSVIKIKKADKVIVTSAEGSANNLESKGEDIAAVFSACEITFDGQGTIYIKSDGNGIKSSENANITSGTISVLKSREGIEGRNVIISGGKILILSEDDGINSSAGDHGETGNCNISITGGTVFINSSGDGVDANGSIFMSGGTLLICGPTEDDYEAIDYDTKFVMSGGTVAATCDSDKKFKFLSEDSTVTGVIAHLPVQKTGTIVRLQNSDGSDILTFAPCKTFSKIAISAPGLKKELSVVLLTGGSCTGNNEFGLYKDGNYSGGTVFKEFTVKEMVTTIKND